MTVFAYDLIHKKQTKANDCWYACIQMLRSQRAGRKTKTIGDAALRLRNVPILGRTLKAAQDNSVFFQILKDNGLVLVSQEMPTFMLTLESTVIEALQKYGPIMIGGMYGRLFGSKKMGHFIILSGIDTDRGLFKIDDPDLSKADWRSYHRVQKDYWGRIYQDDGCNAIAAAPG